MPITISQTQKFLILFKPQTYPISKEITKYLAFLLDNDLNVGLSKISVHRLTDLQQFKPRQKIITTNELLKIVST